MMTPTFEQGFAKLCAAFDVSDEFREKKANNYWITLKGVDGQAFLRAATKIIDESEAERMPTPAKLKRMCSQEKGRTVQWDAKTWEYRRELAEKYLGTLYELRRQRELSESEKDRIRRFEAILAVDYEDPRYTAYSAPPAMSDEQDPLLSREDARKLIRECINIVDKGISSPSLNYPREEPPF